MKDLKNKLLDSVNKTKEFAEKKIKEIDTDELKNKVKSATEAAEKKIKEIDVDDVKGKIKEAAEKTNQKLDESGVKDKVSTALSDDNKKMACKKLTSAVSKVKGLKLPLAKIIIGVVSAAVVIAGVCSYVAFTADKTPVATTVNEIKTNYVYDDNKLFGEALAIDDGSIIKVRKDKVLVGMFDYKIKAISKETNYFHSASGVNVKDANFVIVASNPFNGDLSEFIFERSAFKADNGKDLKGYKLKVVHKDAKVIYPNDFTKIIFTKYYETKK